MDEEEEVYRKEKRREKKESKPKSDEKKEKKSKSSKTDDTKEKKSKKVEKTPEIDFLQRFAEATLNDETWRTQGQNFIWIPDLKNAMEIAEVVDRDKNSKEFVVQLQNGEKRK